MSELQIPENLQIKLDKIKEIFKDKDVMVAFSGGLDSSFVVYCAKIYAKSVLGVLIHTQATPKQEINNAKTVADAFNISLEIMEIDIIREEKISNNQTDRCYYCKKKILEALSDLGTKNNLEHEKFDLFVDGTNFSDLSQERPGLKALEESPFRSPLAEAGITKQDVKILSKIFDLPSKEIPSQACLASRIPFGIPLTKEILEMTDRAESYIREYFNDYISPLRVRIHKLKPHDAILARIETNEILMKKMQDQGEREKITEKFREIGFTFITLDLQGFRSGSMHEEL